jgi:hypothetical protein
LWLVCHGTRLAQNGWAQNQPRRHRVLVGRDYVFVMATCRRDTDANNLPTLAHEMIEEVSRLTWNYFNADQPLLQRREPISPYGAVECISFNPENPELVDLNNIDANRIDAEGNPLPTACYGGALSYYANGGACNVGLQDGRSRGM